MKRSDFNATCFFNLKSGRFVLILNSLLVFMLAMAEDFKVYSILDYGGKSSLETLNTSSIQAAMDACSESGGGIVIIPKGVYITGTLFIRSNVTLQLEAGVELFGSSNLEDYAEVPLATEEPHFSKCLFFAKNVENFKIVGHPRSEINGRGYFFKHSPERPKLFRIEESRNIDIENTLIKNSGSWCLYFRECDQIHLYKVAVYNKENRNNDGINFDGCSNVTIQDCNLQVEDDAICLKSSVDKICENFLIENCTVSSYWAGLKFGTASKTGFRNIKIRNCQFFDCRFGTIKLLAVDGAIIEDVEISDIDMYNCGGPIFIRLGNRGRTYEQSIKQVYATDVKPEGRPVGKIRNLILRNIKGRLTGRLDPPTEGMMLTGLPGHYIEDVVMENIHFSFTGFGQMDAGQRVIPEDEARYPEQLFFGVLPSYGLYARHVRGLEFKNVTFALRDEDTRSAVLLNDVLQSHFERFEVDVTHNRGAAVVLDSCQNLEFSGLKAKGKAQSLVNIKGVASCALRLKNPLTKTLEMETLATFTDEASVASLLISN